MVDDYAKHPIRACAVLVLDGAKQLDEFPASRRTAIASAMKQVEEERIAAAEAAAKEEKKSARGKKTKG